MLKIFRLVYALLVLPVFVCCARSIRAQTLANNPAEQPYSFHRSWSLFSEYSPGSSHIFLGIAREREFFTVGGAFTQRLFLKRYAGLSYTAEIRPLILESDPVLKSIGLTVTDSYGTISTHYTLSPALPVIQTGPSKISLTDTENGIVATVTFLFDYSRRWTYVFGLSPVGLQANFLPRSRIQPVFTGLGGFAVSPRDIPMFNSSAFNFTFSIGGGVEFLPYGTPRIAHRISHPAPLQCQYRRNQPRHRFTDDSRQL
jgi:hypothetical protein